MFIRLSVGYNARYHYGGLWAHFFRDFNFIDIEAFAIAI